MSRTMPATPLFQTNGVPNAALVELLKLTGIHVPADIERIHEATQENWLKKGLTPAQIQEEHGHIASQATPLFRALGLNGVPTVKPGRHEWAIQMGSMYTGLHRRFAYAVQQWDEGVTWDKYCILTSSNRPRQKDGKESDEIIVTPVSGALPFFSGWTEPDVLPENEAELAKLVLSQIGHHRRWNIDYEHVTIASGNGAANTTETLRAFAFDHDPRGDSLLIISSQPHILRQGIEAAVVLGNRFKSYVVTGYDMPETQNVTKKLDELAKLIHLLFTV